MNRTALGALCCTAIAWQTAVAAPEDLGTAAPYVISSKVQSRSQSPENPRGEKGAGGQSASRLGPGRKGSPTISIAPGEEKEIFISEGPGVVRHIWMTGSFAQWTPAQLRSVVVRAWWEDQKHPSIECPLPEFMGAAHGVIAPYESAVHTMGRNSAFNFWLPMPFREKGRITLTNEETTSLTVYYQVDYTTGDELPENTGRLHTLFRRENTTKEKQDFELLPRRKGSGRFVGCLFAVRTTEPGWWGEGEVKFYMDGDDKFPTIVGTGAEDYICLSYGVQETPYMFHGCNLDRDGYIGMYRWHLPDPIVWQKDCRVTIQQIGYDKARGGLFEREDDWSAATFWYEPTPSAPLPPFPDLKARTANLPPKDLLSPKAEEKKAAPLPGL